MTEVENKHSRNLPLGIVSVKKKKKAIVNWPGLGRGKVRSEEMYHD